MKTYVQSTVYWETHVVLQISFSKIDYILKVFINLNKYCDTFENAFCLFCHLNLKVQKTNVYHREMS